MNKNSFQSAESDVVFFAPNVHVGGGLVLLKELIKYAPSSLNIRWMVSTELEAFLGSDLATISYFNKGVVGRIVAEIRLSLLPRKSGHIICFHGVPSLLPIRKRQTVYLQNALLLSTSSLTDYSFKAKLRLYAERLVLRLRWNSVDRFLVQTPDMANKLKEFSSKYSLRAPKFHILPFVANGLGTNITDGATDTGIAPIETAGAKNVIYPSYAQPHKNHHMLVKAWCLLLRDHSIDARLTLTITKEEFESVCGDIEIAENELSSICLIGKVDHAELLSKLSKSDAMVFPSLTESFGLPLVESSILGVPILASELDFVRDVCRPQETFNPCSEVSIKRAFERFFKLSNHPIKIKSSHDFWSWVIENK